jgi:hypothetical protein
MAISVVLRFRREGDVMKYYDAVIDDMGLRGGGAPKGAIYHFAARSPDGLFVADTWETRDAFEQFSRDQITPLGEKHGFSAPEIEYSDVFETIDGGISSKGGTGMVATFEGNTDELCRIIDKVNERMGAAKNPPPGLVFHEATKRPNGVRIIDHWTSRADFERFLNGRLGEALQGLGAPQPRVEYYDVYNTIDGRRVRV